MRMTRNWIRAAALAVPMLAAALLSQAPPASAAPISLTGVFQSFGGSWNVGKCLDVQDAGTSAGTEIDSGWCNGTAAQKWTILHCQLKCPGMLIQAGVGSYMCMGVPRSDGIYQGSPVKLVPCDKGDGNQIWAFSNGLIHLQASWDWCLDVNDGNTGQDIYVDVATCNGTNAQLWQPDGFTVVIQSAISTGTTSNCLDDYGYATNGRVDSYTCNSGNAQIWYDYGYIQNASNGSIVQAEAPNSSGDAPTYMVSSPSGSWPGNDWYLKYSGYGYSGNSVSFINGFTGPNGSPECLDVLGASPAVGQPVDLALCNSTVAQAWMMSLYT